MPNSAELIVSSAVKSLVNGRCFPDVAPAGTPRPYITFQAAGGKSQNYLADGVSQRNSRQQITVWAADRITASGLMESVTTVLTGAPIFATNIGAPVSVYEADTKLYGSRLDFSIWFTP